MTLTTITRLFTPLIYLRITHPVKKIYDFIIPSILSLITIVLYHYIPHKPGFFGVNGIIPYISELMKILSAFYIAALAAVATFSNGKIDEIMKGTPPKLKTQYGTNGVPYRELTRRQYLCFMLGYLAFSSISMYFIGYIATVVHLNTNFSLSLFLLCIRWILTFLYLFYFYNIIITTLLALHFLSDRIHR